VCVLIGVGAWVVYTRMRSQRLQQHFGAEYGRTVERTKIRDLAEAELESRRERVSKYKIVPLSDEDRVHYQRAWEQAQTRFVDDPSRATREADELIMVVMEKRGYPVNGFEQAAADLSVNHPVVVENYRAAAAIARRNRQGEANTEDLRQALVRYRTLFNELLQPGEPVPESRGSSYRGSERQTQRRLKSTGGGFRA
jgi:hypothetical protein